MRVQFGFVERASTSAACVTAAERLQRLSIQRARARLMGALHQHRQNLSGHAAVLFPPSEYPLDCMTSIARVIGSLQLVRAVRLMRCAQSSCIASIMTAPSPVSRSASRSTGADRIEPIATDDKTMKWSWLVSAMSPERSDSIDTASSTDSDGPSVDLLPPELLEAIFHRLALSVSSKDSLESPNPSRIHPLALICRHWREPAQRTLQRFVRLGTPRQAISYGNFLRDHPHARDRLNRLDALNETGLFVVRAYALRR